MDVLNEHASMHCAFTHTQRNSIGLNQNQILGKKIFINLYRETVVQHLFNIAEVVILYWNRVKKH